MKFLYSIIVLFVSLPVFSFSVFTKKPEIAKKSNGFALIELYTSEGCSTCPPADIVAEEVQKQYSDKNVLVLGFHVDYWDRLGWKDIFSDTLFTERQKYYSNIFHLNSIYTPQIIVNGETEFVGSDKIKLISSIEMQLKQKPHSSIKLKAVMSDTARVDVSYFSEGGSHKKDQFVIVLVQKTAMNKINRGENEGRTLQHINIVRAISYSAVLENEGKMSFNLPAGLLKEDVFVAGFIQEVKSGEIKAMLSSAVE